MDPRQRRHRPGHHDRPPTRGRTNPCPIAQAHRATEAGPAARFVQAEVYDVADVLEPASYDVVVATYGVLVWLPDLDEFARLAARMLRPSDRQVGRAAGRPAAADPRDGAGRRWVVAPARRSAAVVC
ncbi:class I SAM-dependent methyltransferase [Kribbella sp. NBC_00709]|uniref:class I SAM-dependent methyltransferase n=1 Tax=Kribbella sp. NBC_00709 TaxID=2975972 RepID=UPI003FA52ED5